MKPGLKEAATETLAEVSAELLRSGSPQSVVENLCRKVMVLLDCQVFFNFLFDPASGRLRLNACAGISEEEARRVEWLDVGVAVCGHVAQHGIRIIAENIEQSGDVRTELVRSHGIKAYACHPMLAQDRVIGTLSFGTKTRVSFTEEEVSLMKTVTDQVAIAMQRKQAEDALRESERLLGAEAQALSRLHEASARLWRTTDLHAGLEQMLDAAMALLSADMGNIQLFDAEKQVLEIAVHRGFQPDFLEFFREVSAKDNSACGRALRQSTRTVIEDVEVDEGFAPYRKVAAAAGFRAVQTTPLVGSGGKPLGMLSTHFRRPHRPSALELQRLDLYVRQAADFIERLNAENALRVAKEQAEQASNAKDRFLAVLSHELRTPLTPVLMAVSALEHEPELTDVMREDLAMMKRNIELETKLIDDLLDISRITTGKLKLEIEAVDLNEAVRHVCEICRPQLHDRGIRLEAELDADAGMVAADPARLQQVLWNVLKNAVKFTSRQGLIRVGTRQLDESRVEVRVQDNGVGIPSDMLPRIFNTFEQGDANVTRQFGGLGLGLAISKALIDLHHGSIRAESEGKGKGATFIIELPGKVLTATARIRLATPPKKQRAPQLRLLVVEDHADTLRTLTRLLSDIGFTVFTASSVAGATELASRETFDVLVSDLGLPDGDGREVMRRVRARGNVLGIAMSGYGTDEDVRRSREAGFSVHLTKPVEFSTLKQTILRLADEKSVEVLSDHEIRTAEPPN